MESTSWTLRIALLLIGLAILGSIYLWATWRRRRERNRSYDRRMRGLRTPPMPRHRDEPDADEFADNPLQDEPRPPPEDDYEIIVVKPREREREHIEELPTITRDPDPDPPTATTEPIVPDAPVARSTRRRRTNQLDLGFDDEPQPAPRTERSSRRERRPAAQPRQPDPQPPAPPAPDVLALYLRPARSPAFMGPVLIKALNAVGMHFGDMNIYHHFGAGELRAEQPLFSLANMFEPGQFDLDGIEEFETAGLAMFIQFPAALDGPVAFELFLNTAQRLAEALDADLLSEPKKPLDSATIENMRVIAARHSDERS